MLLRWAVAAGESQPRRGLSLRGVKVKRRVAMEEVVMERNMPSNCGAACVVMRLAVDLAVGHACKYCDADSDSGDHLSTHSMRSPVNPKGKRPKRAPAHSCFMGQNIMTQDWA